MAFNNADKMAIAASSLIGCCRSLQRSNGTLETVINERWIKGLLEHVEKLEKSIDKYIEERPDYA